MVFARQRRHLERYLQIGRVLARHGWQNLVARAGLTRVFGLRRTGGAVGPAPAPVQVREAIEELGPAFIKLGQLLSTRPDIIPANYIVELEKLQDTAPPVPIEDVYQVIREEFGEPVDLLFEEFNPIPLGSASIGQTHAARMPDGRSVVVKVQRPNIVGVIDNDLEIVAGIARFLDNHFEQLRVFSLPDVVDELSISMHHELDYTREGRNGDTLRRNLQHLDYVRVAETIWERTACRVLTQEYLSGTKISSLRRMGYSESDLAQIASNLSRAFLTMVLVDGFFHADPHPGNLLVMPDNVIGLVDYGMVGRLDRQLKTGVIMLLSNYVRQDSQGFSEILLDIGVAPPNLNRKRYAHTIDRFLRQYYDAPLHEVQMGKVLRDAVHISAKFGVTLPSALALLVKALVQTEAIAKELMPDYDFTDEARGFILRAMWDEFSPRSLTIQAVQTLLSWKNLFFGLPHRTGDVLERMASGTFRIEFKHEGLEAPIQDIDRSANRLSFALIASATIIGSSLVLAAGIGPRFNGVPVIGLIGFAIAFLFVMALIISIIRTNKLW